MFLARQIYIDKFKRFLILSTHLPKLSVLFLLSLGISLSIYGL